MFTLHTKSVDGFGNGNWVWHPLPYLTADDAKDAGEKWLNAGQIADFQVKEAGTTKVVYDGTFGPVPDDAPTTAENAAKFEKFFGHKPASVFVAKAPKAKKPAKTYESWYAKVEAKIVAKYGIGINDLPDIDLISLYEDGTSPAAAAKALLKNAGE